MGFELERIPSAKQRYPELFAFIDAIVDLFSQVIDAGALPVPKTQIQFVRVSSVIRTYNLLKSIRQLLAVDHWENAAILMRALFELTLNIEELERNSSKAEEQAERFIRFETLQQYRRLKAEAEYEIRTGRKAGHDPKLISLEASLPTIFSEWATKRKDGTIKWKTSWCDKNVRELCEASGSHIRLGQYEVVYAFGSDMAHSSPLSVLSTFHESLQFFGEHDQSERRATLMVMSLSVTFACEIVGLMKFIDGAFDPLKMLQLTRKIYELYDVSPPALHPQVEAAMKKL